MEAGGKNLSNPSHTKLANVPRCSQDPPAPVHNTCPCWALHQKGRPVCVNCTWINSNSIGCSKEAPGEQGQEYIDHCSAWVLLSKQNLSSMCISSWFLRGRHKNGIKYSRDGDTCEGWQGGERSRSKMGTVLRLRISWHLWQQWDKDAGSDRRSFGVQQDLNLSRLVASPEANPIL
jgi:hypothetical protein